MSANVLIVQPDAALAQRMGQIIMAGTPGASVAFVQTPQEAMAAFDQYADLALCICEVYYEDADGLALLSAIRARFRRARVIIVTSYNLANFGDHIQGLTLFPTPLDEGVFMSTCQDALTTLEGHVFAPFQIGKKQPPDRWGDCYAAYDMGVKRDIFITVAHAWATAQESIRFRSFAALMARAGHPNVQAVYQAGEYQGRDYFSREKWDMPNLAEMATAGQGIDPRVAAQIIHIVGSVVIFWDANKYPHGTIGATDVSVSPQGVIKVANCVDPTRPLTPPGVADLSVLAHAVRLLLPPDQIPPRVSALIEKLLAGPVALAQVVNEAQGIDTDLAPERQIAVSQEHQFAQQAIEAERRKQKRNLYIMIGVSVLVVLMVGYFIYDRFLADPPSHQYNEMVEIPAGAYVYQDGPATLDHTFYIDKYEVTFGQYLKFLRAVRTAGNDTAWKHPSQPDSKSWDHEPKDWADHVDANGDHIAGIFRCIKYQEPYNHVVLTLDDPVFNVDWYDAEAYAKWAGKRLPDEHEWEKAGRGTQGFLFPWGNTFEQKGNNSVPMSDEDRGSVPTHVFETVDQMPEDKSPYGVYDMAGNVSEWTDNIVASSRLESVKVAVIRGANFKTSAQQNALLTHRTTTYVPETRDFWLGFRCASDTQPAAK